VRLLEQEDRHEGVAATLLSTAMGRGERRARLPVIGGSMEPLLRSGDQVLIEPLSGSPGVGDILLFVGPRGLVCHRLVAPRGAGYVLRGDRSPTVDTVGPDALLARVTAIQRGERLLDLHGGLWAWRSRAIGNLAALKWSLAGRIRLPSVRRIGALFVQLAERLLAGRLCSSLRVP